jgi:hypothetical protein
MDGDTFLRYLEYSMLSDLALQSIEAISKVYIWLIQKMMNQKTNLNIRKW